MTSQKYPDLTKKDYNNIYMSIYYYLNRDKLLAKAARKVSCKYCSKIMPYSSMSYHLKKFHSSDNPNIPKLKNEIKREDGTFVLTFD